MENLQHGATIFTPHKCRRYGLCGTIGIDKNEKKEYNIYIRLRELRKPNTDHRFSTNNNQKLKEKNNSKGVDEKLKMWYNNKGERFTDKKIQQSVNGQKEVFYGKHSYLQWR